MPTATIQTFGTRLPDPLERKKRASSMAFVHGFLTVFALPFLYVFQAGATDDADYTRKLCVAFTIGASWLLISCYIVCREFYHPYFMFLISAIMFNGGQFFLVGTGLLSPGLLMFGRFSPSTVNLTIYLIFSSLLMLHLGVLVYVALHRVILPRSADHDLSMASARQVGFALMLIGALPFIGALIGDLRAAAQGYGDMYVSLGVGEKARGVLANLFIPGLIFALVGSSTARFRVRLLLTLAGLAMAAYLVTGTRSRAMTLAAALLFVWSRCINRIPKSVTLGLAASFVLIVPIVAVIRNLPIAERFSASGISSAFSGDSNIILAMFNETGMTTATTAMTVDLVPQSRPFGFGLTYLNAILLSVPGTGQISASAKEPLVLSDWLIWQADPAAAEGNGGFGFSFIAEAYLNFGAFFGPLMCGGIGLLIAYLIFRKDDVLSIAFTGCLLLTLPMLSRGESITISRGLLEQCLPPLVAASYLMYRSRLVEELRSRSNPLPR